jgi:TonB family protein
MGQALYAKQGAAAAAGQFPGLDLETSTSRRRRFVTSGISLALHGGILLALIVAAWLNPPEVVEELIKLERVQDEPAKEAPAPRPRVVAERSMPVFDPSVASRVPQIQNPVVIQDRVPEVAATKIDIAPIAPIQAPQDVARNTPMVVESARTFASNAPVVTAPVLVEPIAAASRGPIEHTAPVGIQSGPRQVATGDTTGIANSAALGSGSSVKEGIVSGRDVHGAKTGARAEVHWAVGDSNLRGSGGDGTGPGGVSSADCMSRPEVQAYMTRMHERMLSRWALPPDVPGNQQVMLRFVLDPAGSATSVKLVSSPDARLGQSAVDALRSASPFDHMSDRVRCLAGNVTGTFRNPETSAN